MQYFPGQRVVASDGAQYILAFQMEGVWLGFAADQRSGLPRPVEPKYPAWGGDDERAGADQAPLAQFPRSRLPRSRRARGGHGARRA